MSKIKTVVVTRSIYTDRISPLRLQLIQDFFIEGWDSQTDKDFKIIVLVHRNTENLIKSLNWEGLDVEFFRMDSPRFEDISKDKQLVKRLNGLNTLQIRMDNDDRVHPTYLERVKKTITGRDEMILSCQATKFVMSTGDVYLSKSKCFNKSRPSNNVAIFQRQFRVHCYQNKHWLMARYFEPKNQSFINELGFFTIAIHAENVSNKP